MDRGLTYIFEGIGEDMPRPPLAALRALLSAGVLVSARAWQGLPAPARQAFARAGAADTVDDALVTELLKQIPVSQMKFVGRRVDPPMTAVPDELAAAIGPSRPLTPAEWAGLRGLDRHVLVSLMKNTRLLAKALNEVLPSKGPGPGIPNVWSGAVARAELRVHRDVLKQVVSGGFMEGRAFVLANVSGRRAARRASELFDEQAESMVGPVEIDWGLRGTDDVLFWQAHVSSWDGTFFPVAALLAASTAATAMFDMVRGLDPNAAIVFAGIREEPWQAGRDDQHDPATALYAKQSLQPVIAAMVAGRDTVITDPPVMSRESSPLLGSGTMPLVPRSVPSAPSSSPQLTAVPSMVPSSEPLSSGRAPVPSSGRNAPSRKKRGRWVGPAIVGLIVLADLLVIFAIAVYLANRK
jgi:molybdenum cofactor biosynthesis enzyme